jgi:hypothetical protein
LGYKKIYNKMETQNYTQRQFMILSVSELPQIDFSQVLETSENTVRKNIDETKTFVKWDSEEIPSSVDLLSTKEGPYTYSEIIEILSSSEWINNEML